MSASVAFVCRGSSGGRLVMIRCDGEDCSAQTTYSSREEYLAAGHAGWRRRGEGETAKHYCPKHAASA